MADSPSFEGSVSLIRATPLHGARIESDDIIATFDCTLTVQQQSSANLTRLPIEADGDGPNENIVDNFSINPTTITLRGIKTDTPLETQGPATFNRANSFLQDLHELRRRAQPLKVITSGRGVFQDMVIVNISEQQNPGQGQNVQPSIQLREVRFVVPAVRYIPPLGRGRNSGQVERGNTADSADDGIERGNNGELEEPENLPPAVMLFGRLLGVA